MRDAIEIGVGIAIGMAVLYGMVGYTTASLMARVAGVLG